jgi:hypothetical protein
MAWMQEHGLLVNTTARIHYSQSEYSPTTIAVLSYNIDSKRIRISSIGSNLLIKRRICCSVIIMQSDAA